MSKEKPESSVETPKAVTAEEFRQHSKNKVQIVKLPSSGVNVRLRKPSMMRVFKSGIMPTDLIRKLQEAENVDLNAPDVDPEQLANNLRAMDYLIADAFLEPKMVIENPKEDEITVDDLDDRDRAFVYEWVQKDVKEMEPFRDESRGQGAGLGGKKVLKKT